MSLNDADQVKGIAKLARIAIDPEDIPEYVRNLSDILRFVEQMNQVETAQVEPLAHPLDVAQRLRPDQVTEADHRDRFQAVAPQVEAGLYLVPKVIE